ncbi:MAG: NOL1/NOP2/sun family putative RNA methylase [Firmicutes bacterium]|nr:NOL1/NOP2/sun family putative RNA methylase [Bacillota bacterium]
MNLPIDFINRMENILKDEIKDFTESFNDETLKGLRINPLKISKKNFIDISPFNLEEVPWCDKGFYIKDTNLRPGKHPYYHCGLYYIQEPSAMIAVEALNPKPGDKVLDLCAAPGGKSTQIAAKLNNKGLLVSNDINPKRTKALEKNMKMFGVKNSIITNENPLKLSNHFENYFDKILVDAPCSGEGMFKRDKKAIKEWSENTSKKYADIQRGILKNVSKMLKPEGILVFSTCTFSPKENEGTIKWLLENFNEFELINIDIDNLDNGLSEAINASKDLEKTKRLWPHKINGDGHFVAKLMKKDSKKTKPLKKFESSKNINIEPFIEFQDKYLNKKLKGKYNLINDRLYLIPNNFPNMKGLRIVNSGLLLGELKRNRFIPSQELAMALDSKDAKYNINLSSKDLDALKYLKGETLMIKDEKSWKLVCIDGYPVGWGKQTKSFLKNYYNKNWRMK